MKGSVNIPGEGMKSIWAGVQETTKGSDNSSSGKVGGVVGPVDDVGEYCGVSVVESANELDSRRLERGVDDPER